MKIQNVIVVSDLHCGCRLGLCPDRPIPLDDGGTYKSSRVQKTLWRWWTEFWHEWVPRVTHGQGYVVVLNGDVLEGVHHRATTQISQNIGDQKAIARMVVGDLLKLKGMERLYWIRGTEAHAGNSGVDENELARELGAAPDRDGRYARWELWLKVGEGLANFSHHIGTTSSAAHETSAINAELAAAYTDAGRWGNRPPDIIVRSHRHRSAEIRLPNKRGNATAFCTAAWQLKTPFTYRNTHGRTSQPQIGGSLIRQGDEELHTRHDVWCLERPEVEA
jgi:hypothetical protein